MVFAAITTPQQLLVFLTRQCIVSAILKDFLHVGDWMEDEAVLLSIEDKAVFVTP